LRGFADPGALLTVVAGIVLVSSNRSYYLHARWLHYKLVFVAVLIGVHGIVAVTNKSVASGAGVIARNHARILFVVILLVFLLILITTLPGEVFLT
ncbi:MAG TPA: CopD family protein, partial [Candidatus Acidoferrum sp.]|nr:CopD family protein [Candidatus Acidoferrum sp.]